MAKVLVLFEFSGTVRKAFQSRGFESYSVDVLPSEDSSPYHFQEDFLEFLKSYPPQIWDLIICHPPCTYLCRSGIHWNKRVPGRQVQTERALDIIRFLLNMECHRIALENPIGVISTNIRKPDQIIQPWQFGHNASKATCLWLKNLPPLTHTEIVKPSRVIDGKGRYDNQTDKGDNNLSGKDRWKERSRTFTGIAQAMADQWTPFLKENKC